MVGDDVGRSISAVSALQGGLSGQRIGKYDVLSHLATGGMAEIYLARASGIENFEKLVVIKRILPQFANNRDFVSMFLDEARIAATLHHSNIVQVFDIGELDGDYYFCMEYLHGRDARKIAASAQDRGDKLSLDESLSIAVGILSGLHYAHERRDEVGELLGIVHRDVSPQNVIVTYDGDVKLVDFGLVKATDRLTESRSGTLKGKLAYMSPEQCLCEDCDRRSDLFSLGVMLWELTTGRRLFTGTSEYHFLKAIVDEDIPRPSSVVPGYPGRLESIVMRALEKSPGGRHATAEEMQLELEAFARDEKLAVSSITLRRMMQRLFEDEIDAARSAAASGRLDEFVAGTFAIDTDASQGLAEGSTRSTAEGSTSQAVKAADFAATTAERVRGSGSSKWWLAALFLFGVGGAVGYLWWADRDNNSTSASEAPEPAASEAANPAASEAPEPTAPAAEPKQPEPEPPVASEPAAVKDDAEAGASETADGEEPVVDTDVASETEPKKTRKHRARRRRAQKASKPSTPAAKPAKTKVDPNSLFPE